MVRRQQETFGGGGQHVYPREDLRITLWIRPDDWPVMFESPFLDFRGAMETVTAHKTSSPNRFRERLAEALFTHISQDIHTSEARFAVAVLTWDEYRFLCRPPASLAPSTLTAVIALVHFNRSSKGVLPVALHHGVTDLVCHGPHGFVTPDAQETLCLQGRAAFLVSHHQGEHPEPPVERNLALVENAPRGQRDLSTAMGGTTRDQQHSVGSEIHLARTP